MIALILLLLFVVLPIVELALLLQISDAIDWPATIGIVLVTGVLGSALARWQGVKVLREIQTQVAGGQLPARALFDGALILVAGAVLITPGVITDVCGFLLLLPPVRTLLAAGLRKWAEARVSVSLGGMGGGFPGSPGGFPGGGFPGGPGGFPGGPEGFPGQAPPGPTPYSAPGGGDVIDVTPTYSGPAREPEPPPTPQLPAPEESSGDVS